MTDDPQAKALRAERDALAARVAELEGAERDLRDLLACIVHDLKNPLSVVASSLDLLHEQIGEAPGLVGEALDEAHQATHRLRLMIDDVMLVTRFQESAPPLQREAVDVRVLLDDVTREFRRAAEDRQIDLFAQPLQPSQPVRVNTDRTLLQRVVQKMVESSLRFTPAHGRVAVATRASGDIEITVAHTGPAIPPSERPRIFDRLAKADGAARTRRTGLALYFCKQAVTALGGEIEVVETDEWPTTFVVHIPAA